MAVTTVFAKKSVTIPADVLEAAREHMGHEGLSAYVSRAMRLQIEQDNLEVLLREAEALHGPADPTEVAAFAARLT